MSSKSFSGKGLVQSMKGWLGKPVATPETDPQRFFGTLYALPNPDPILREMGQSDRVYHSIMADPHVIGEIRSVRGSFRSNDYRLLVGEANDAKAAAALDLCQKWMRNTRPNAVADWLEVMWQMSSSVLTGYRVHELVWGLVDGMYLPTQVIDRPGRRFKFDAHAAPLLVSRDNWQGQSVEPYQFVVSRHMATTDNPYGMALLSSCFWPWTFKTGGWRYFVKYCERHGLPWPIGRYAPGTGEAEQDALADALANMLEAGYIVMQQDNNVELLVPQGSSSGALPQQNLITLCNREMSKALTSQAMIGEQLDVGSRAASETAKDRQESVHDADRDIAAESMGEIFKWITQFNFGDGVAAPTMEFYLHKAAGKDRAETYAMAARMGAKPSRRALLEELDMPVAEGPDDELVFPTTALSTAPGSSTTLAKKPADKSVLDFSALPGYSFAQGLGLTEDDAVELASLAADTTLSDNAIAPVYDMLVQFEKDGKSLNEFKTALEGMVGQLDDEGLREVIDRALMYSIAAGAVDSGE
jgi:phage gp29-like protein